MLLPLKQHNIPIFSTYFTQILDYDEITGCDAIAIGRKGKRVNPPRFQFPMSVAADRLGNVYVADYGNARIQILDFKGQVAREPLPLGGKCRPCALAVSFRGDLLMTDSQILRLFSKTGKSIERQIRNVINYTINNFN